MANDAVTIENIKQWDDLDASGKSRERIRVQWKLGNNGPFYDYFPCENFDPAAARLVIDERARKFQDLQR